MAKMLKKPEKTEKDGKKKKVQVSLCQFIAKIAKSWGLPYNMIPYPKTEKVEKKQTKWRNGGNKRQIGEKSSQMQAKTRV